MENLSSSPDNPLNQKDLYILSNLDFHGLKVKKLNYKFDCCESAEANSFNKIIIHHSGKYDSIDKILNNHIIKKKYSTIGYHFVIGKNGVIYYSRDLKYAGAHTFGYNKNGIGIALLGDFNEEKPSEKQISSLKTLISTLISNFKIEFLFAHNEAIYKQIKHNFWKLNLPDLDLESFLDLEEYINFQKDVTTKILEFDASDETVSLIKKLKTCPGFNLYKPIGEIKSELKF